MDSTKKQTINSAEFNLLSIFMCSPTAKESIVTKISKNDFSNNIHKNIFGAILALFNEGKEVDSVTLIEYLQRQKIIENSGGKQYIQHLYSNYVGDTYCDNYLDLIIENSNLIRLKEISQWISSTVDDGKVKSLELLAKVDNEIQKITNKSKEDNLKSINYLSEKVYNNIKKLSLTNLVITGLSSGYAQLDKLTSGFQKGDLIILAARPSMGKTALALNIALNIASSKINKKEVIFFSLEMPSEQLVARIFSISTHIDMQKIKTGQNLNADEWARIEQYHKDNTNVTLSFDDSANLNILSLQLKLKKICKEKENVGLVVIDYLQLLSLVDRVESRQQEISKISRQLKILARQLNVPIMCISQLSRNVERREDKRPIMSDLRDSGSIEQDADLVLLLYREEYYNHSYVKDGEKSLNDNVEEVEVILSKNRNGPTGKISLAFAKKIGLFVKK